MPKRFSWWKKSCCVASRRRKLLELAINESSLTKPTHLHSIRPSVNRWLVHLDAPFEDNPWTEGATKGISWGPVVWRKTQNNRIWLQGRLRKLSYWLSQAERIYHTYFALSLELNELLITDVTTAKPYKGPRRSPFRDSRKWSSWRISLKLIHTKRGRLKVQLAEMRSGEMKQVHLCTRFGLRSVVTDKAPLIIKWRDSVFQDPKYFNVSAAQGNLQIRRWIASADRRSLKKKA